MPTTRTASGKLAKYLSGMAMPSSMMENQVTGKYFRRADCSDIEVSVFFREDRYRNYGRGD